MKLPHVPGPPQGAPHLPDLGAAVPHASGGQAEKLVDECKGDAAALARSLAGAAPHVKDEVFTEAAEKYGNAFVSAVTSMMVGVAGGAADIATAAQALHAKLPALGKLAARERGAAGAQLKRLEKEAADIASHGTESVIRATSAIIDDVIATVEQVTAKSAKAVQAALAAGLPRVIDGLRELAGLGGAGDAARGVIGSVRAGVDAALAKVVDEAEHGVATGEQLGAGAIAIGQGAAQHQMIEAEADLARLGAQVARLRTAVVTLKQHMKRLQNQPALLAELEHLVAKSESVVSISQLEHKAAEAEAMTKIVETMVAIVLAIIEVVVAVVMFGGSTLLIAVAVAAIVSAVVTVLATMPMLLAAMSEVASAAGLDGAAGSLDKAGAWWNTNISNAKWFEAMCAVIAIVIAIDADIVALGVKAPGAVAGSFIEVLSTEGATLTTGVDAALTQARDAVRQQAASLNNRIDKAAGAGMHRLADGLKVFRDRANTVASEGHVERAGALAQIGDATKTVANATDKVIGVVTGATSAVANEVMGGAMDVANGAMGAVDAIGNGDPSGVIASVTGAVDGVASAASHVVNDLIGGATGAVNDVAGALQDGADQGASALSNATGIHF